MPRKPSYPDDSPETIDRCLQCAKTTCDNCAAGGRGHYRRAVSAYTKAGKFVAAYPSMTAAAKAVNGRTNKISDAVTRRVCYRGFRWKAD